MPTPGWIDGGDGYEINTKTGERRRIVGADNARSAGTRPITVRMADGTTQDFTELTPDLDVALQGGAQIIDTFTGQPFTPEEPGGKGTGWTAGGKPLNVWMGEAPTSAQVGAGYNPDSGSTGSTVAPPAPVPDWIDGGDGYEINTKTGERRRIGTAGQPPPTGGGGGSDGLPLFDENLLAPWTTQFEAPPVRQFDPSSLPNIPKWDLSGLPQVPEWDFNFDPSQIQDDPSYQFIRDEGIRGVKRQASAEQRLGGGRTLKDLARWNTGLASTFMNDYYNQDFNEATTGYNAKVGDYNRGYQEYLAGYGADLDTYGRGLNEWSIGYGTDNDAYRKAREEYDLSRGIFRENQIQPFNMLNTVAGRGTVAGSQIQGEGANYGSGVSGSIQNTGTNLSNLATNAGDLRASGFIGAQNANNQFNPANNLQNLYLLNRFAA